MEGWVGLVGWPIADTLPTKSSHVNQGSGVDQEKFASQRLASEPLNHAANKDGFANEGGGSRLLAFYYPLDLTHRAAK